MTAGVAAGRPVTPEQWFAVQAFLFEEAALLDAHRYDDWLSLFDPEQGVYWVPAESHDTDPTRQVSVIYDPYPKLRDRVSRISSGDAHAQTPFAVTCRMIGNLRVVDDGTLVHAEATGMVAEFRRQRERIHVAHYRYELLPSGDSWRIKLKVARLVNAGGPLPNLAVLL
jgi:3-phenylpropionate/cinnamic acid dioxygenase small subunit